MPLQTEAEEASSPPIPEADREEAREIQQSLLPEGPLKGAAFEVAYRFFPFAGVGGDFADFFMLPNGLLGLYLGDVVGKGLPAALYAALVMGMLRGIHKTGQDTASSLSLLNKRMLVRPVTGRYCATLYALFDPSSGVLTFSNAGLPHPILVSESGCSMLGAGGLPSGLFPGTTYDSYRVELAAGDAVLFATDGLHEIRDDRNNDFSWGKLGQTWGRCRCKSADGSLDFLFEEAVKFTAGAKLPHDDITAVVLKVSPK
ncbi:MAG TPA: PP2C family protein-serine/threonine phosphatase [Candidatus Acidoferrales bacterium]